MSQMLLKKTDVKTSAYSLAHPLMSLFRSSNRDTILPTFSKAHLIYIAIAFSMLYTTRSFGFYDSNKTLVVPATQLLSAAPIANDDNLETDEEVFFSSNVSDNDSDPDGDALSYSLVGSVPASQGTLFFYFNGSFTFIPAKDFSGLVTVTYKVCDPTNACATATLRINVKPSNDPPIGTIVITKTFEDTPKGGDLKTAVSDVDNTTNTLIFRQIGIMSSIEGTFTLSSTGIYLYTPAPNYVGTTAATYQVCDPGNLCDTSTVILTIIKVNDPPVALNDTVGLIKNTTLNGTVSTNDKDPDHILNELTFNLLDIPSPAQGTITFRPNGTYTFTPTNNYTGTIGLRYKVCDPEGACDTAILYLVVVNTTSSGNYSPIASDITINPKEDSTVTGDLKNNVYDFEDPVTSLTFSPITTVPDSVGVLTLNPNGTYTFTPTPNFNAPFVFTYKVCDTKGLCDTAKININIKPVNDKPVVTPTVVNTPEDTPITVCTPINDPDRGDIFTPKPCGVQIGTANFTVNGSQLCIEYTPKANFSGPDTVCVIVCDTSIVCDTLKVPVTVTPVNDKPVVTPLSITTPEDTVGTVCMTINDPDTGDAFNASICGAKHGNPTYTVVGDKLCVSYLPDADYNGLDTICLILCDKANVCDTIKIPVTVTPVNDKPFADPVVIITIEEATATVCTKINDPDAGDTFNVTPCGAKFGTVTATVSGNDLCITYKPNNNFYGPDTACVIVCDNMGACDTLRVPVTVSPVNDKPIVTPLSILTVEDSTVTVCTNITDPDASEVFSASICGVKNGSATPNIVGNQVCITYSPSAHYNGLDTICLIVCDKANACDTIKIPVVVTPVNDKPVTTPVTITTPEDNIVTVCTKVNDPDVGDILNVTPCGAKSGTVTATLSGFDLCVTYNPNPNFHGSDTACVIVCDAAGACDTVKIPVTVTPVNDKIKITPIDILTNEDSTVTVCTTITDADIDEVFSASVCGAKNGTVTHTLTGNQLCVTYKPKDNYNGRDTVCMIICDKGNLCDTIKIPVVIVAVNDTPSVLITPVSVLKDSIRQFCFKIEDNDAGDTHKVTLCGTKEGSSTMTVVNDQVCITYTTKTSFLGQDTICINICDSSNVCKQILIPVTVTLCNDLLAPIMTCPKVIEVSAMGSVISDPSNFINTISIADNCQGVKLDYKDVVGTDDCGTPTVAQISGLTRSDVFTVGTHPLGFEATDLSGKTSRCAVNITVVPIELLSISTTTVCPNDILNIKANQYPGAKYQWTGPKITTVDSSLLTVSRIVEDDERVYVVSATIGLCTFTDSITATYRVKPELNNDGYRVNINTELNKNVIINDVSVNPAKNVIKIASPIQHGNVTIKADGSFNYKPSLDFTGTESFVYQVCPIGCPTACENATATIQVFNEKFANTGTNVITPNNDGLNDVLEIDGHDGNAANNRSEIVIYNQWGVSHRSL
jgi:hypothetical protein